MTLKGHTSYVNAAVFSPRDPFVLTASADTTARLWNVETGKTLAILKGHRGYLNAGVFSLDGTRILTVSSDKTAKLWAVFFS